MPLMNVFATYNLDYHVDVHSPCPEGLERSKQMVSLSDTSFITFARCILFTVLFVKRRQQ